MGRQLIFEDVHCYNDIGCNVGNEQASKENLRDIGKKKSMYVLAKCNSREGQSSYVKPVLI